MKNTGIWLDKNKALIVTLEDSNETLKSVLSNIDHYNVRGGSGTPQKGGPQNVVHDSKYLEREQQQLKAYFKSISEEINNTDALVIFGPAGTNEKLSKELHENYQHLGSKIKGVRKADRMTDNQVKAWVRDFYMSK